MGKAGGLCCGNRVLQVFAQPVYENLERGLTEQQVWPSKQPRLMRGLLRSIYVVLVTFVAICVPFFSDLMGLIGAIGFTPMTFILPCVFWLKVWLCDLLAQCYVWSHVLAFDLSQVVVATTHGCSVKVA